MHPQANDAVTLNNEAAGTAAVYEQVQAQLANQTPEERELYLAIVREARRVKELDLLIAEERRKEREAHLAALYHLQGGQPQVLSGDQHAQSSSAAAIVDTDLARTGAPNASGSPPYPNPSNYQYNHTPTSQAHILPQSHPLLPQSSSDSFGHQSGSTPNPSLHSQNFSHLNDSRAPLSRSPYPSRSASGPQLTHSPLGLGIHLNPQGNARSQSLSNSSNSTGQSTSAHAQFRYDDPSPSMYSHLMEHAQSYPGAAPPAGGAPSGEYRNPEMALGWGESDPMPTQSLNGMTTVLSTPAGYPRPGPSHPYGHHSSQGNYRPTADTYQVAALLRSPRREHPSGLQGTYEGSGLSSTSASSYPSLGANGDSPYGEGNSPPQSYPLIPVVPSLAHQNPSTAQPPHAFAPPFSLVQGQGPSGPPQLQQRLSTPSDSPSPNSYFSPPIPGITSSHTIATSPSIGLSSANPPKKVKKLLVERPVTCAKCSYSICKLLLRGTSEELSQECDLYYECLRCIPPTLPSSGLGINKQVKKRTRQTEDLSVPTVCDVCIKTVGRGGLIPKQRGFPVGFAVEVVCTPCAARYSRCSDCGGGSGRVGVGKWRAKELFENGRKTCRLPHVRLGSGEIEVSVWELTHEIENRKELPSLMNHLKTLWSERVLARLAIPEVLEGGDDEHHPDMNDNPQRTFADVEALINKGWPAREKCIQSTPPPGFRRYLGLSWAKTRARRERASGKTAESKANGNDYDPANDTLMENVRRTTVLVPQASTLVGMWLLDWSPSTRSLLLSTSAPFETADAEDRSIVGVGEILTRVMQDFMQYNVTHPEAPLQPPQHLWVAARSVTPAGNARMNDTLTRRRGFLSLEEYLRMHTGVDRSIFTNIPEGHTWDDEPGWTQESSDLDILVRWLGSDIDMEKLETIKEMEYGKKSREMAIAKGRRVIPPPFEKK